MGAASSDQINNSRARTTSGGKYVTLGAMEQQDVVSLINYAVGRRDVDANQIGILGTSMGGASAILAAARDKRLRAVVDDSGFRANVDVNRVRPMDVITEVSPGHC